MRVGLRAGTTDQEFYEEIIHVLKDQRLTLAKILAHLDGETEKDGDDGNADTA